MLRRGVLFLVVAACAALSLPSVAAEADAKVQLKLSMDGKEKGQAKDLHNVVEAIAERLQLLTDDGSKYDLSLGSQGEAALEEAVIKVWEDIKKGGAGSLSGSGSEGDDETEVGDDEDIEEIPSTEDEEGDDGEEAEPTKEEVKKSRKHVAKKHAAKKHVKKHAKKHSKSWWDSAASKIDDVLHSVASKASDVADTIGEHVSNAVNKTGEALEDAFGSGSDDEEDEDSSEEDDDSKKAKKVVKKAKKVVKKVKKDVKKHAKKHAKKDKNGKGILDTIHHAWDSVASKADDVFDHIASKADDLADHVFGSDSDEDELKVKSINLAQKKDQGGMSMQTIAAIGSVVGALVGVIVVAMVIVVNRRNAGHGEMSPDPVVDEDAADVESTETTHLDENKADETEGKFEGTV